MRYFFYILSALLLSGCISPKPEKNPKPYWLKENALLNTSLVVGYAPSTFQGMFMQRENALYDGRKKLSFNIRSIVSSKNIENIVVYQKKISLESIKNTDAFSKVILDDIKQFDAYIDQDNSLYLLMGISSENIKIKYKHEDLKLFDKKELLESKCYSRNILDSISTSAYFYKKKPLWFYNPNIDGYHSSIGIAEKTDENYEIQKQTALLLAKSNLSKQIRSKSSSKIHMLEILKDDEVGVLLESSSTHKSSAKIKSFKIKDTWLDPKTCELYILVYTN